MLLCSKLFIIFGSQSNNVLVGSDKNTLLWMQSPLGLMLLCNKLFYCLQLPIQYDARWR